MHRSTRIYYYNMVRLDVQDAPKSKPTLIYQQIVLNCVPLKLVLLYLYGARKGTCRKNYLVYTRNTFFSVCLFAGSVDLRLCGCNCKARYSTTEYYVI